MTIRLPKVPVPEVPVNFRVRNEDNDFEFKTFWISLYDRLFMDRILFLSGLIDNTTVTRIVALMMFLDRDDDDILMYINSSGGDARSAITIYDNMVGLVPDVSTFVTGLAASSASLILAGGTVGKRIAFPNARVMIHQPVAGHFSGPPDMLALEAKQMLRLRNRIANIYKYHTEQPLSVIQQDLEREKYMSAEEAQIYGIIDLVSQPQAKKPLDRDNNPLEQEKNRSFF